ncbi:hypothetical protein EJB05_08123, partial [Eragrostis curvula]
MFLWQFAHNCLLVKRNIARRGIKLETLCPVCNRLDEDSGHLFFKCKKAKEVWRSLDLELHRVNLRQCTSAHEVIEYIWKLDRELQLKCVVLLRKWWGARNKENANESMPGVNEICRTVLTTQREIQGLSTKNASVRKARNNQWKPPPAGVYKINTDRAFCQATHNGGWGFVARDDHGVFLEGGCGKLSRISSALHAEALAALHGVERAAELGMPHIILETDAAVLGNALRTNDMDRSPLGCLFRQIKAMLAEHFESVDVHVCPRECNRVADSMASYGGQQGVGSIITAQMFESMLSHRGDSGCQGAFYTYDAFIEAAKNFPAFGTTGNDETRRRELAAFFGQTSHETTGGWATAPGGPFAWGYCRVNEQSQTDPPYYGRGPIQLAHKYNYQQAGQALGLDLVNNPDMVSSNPVVAFKTAIWFWMTPQSPKPSCHDVMTNNWTPSADDRSAGRLSGYGETTNIINGK